MSELRPPDRDPVIARWIVPAVALSLLLLGAAGVVLLAQYGGLPDRFPTHYDMEGKADAFRTKSAALVALPLAMGVLATVLLALLAYGIAMGTRCPGTGAAREERVGQRRVYAGTLLALTVTLSLLFSYVSLLPVAGPGGMPGAPWVIVALVILILLLAFWLAIRLADTPGEGETPQECWKGKVIYYNREDPALMVERRLGFGYTPNYARPLGWMLMALALGLAATPFVLLRLG